LPYIGGMAAEPGLDYRTVDVEGFDVPTSVTIVDYCAAQRSVSPSLHHVVEIEDYVTEPRPNWAKVRWINVNGLNWKCIKFLATKYNLHRLAIEDLLSVQRTKVDSYKDRKFSLFVAYRRHLYLSVDACTRGGGR
jgi:Mg2+ and Co2+ transporter CorA